MDEELVLVSFVSIKTNLLTVQCMAVTVAMTMAMPLTMTALLVTNYRYVGLSVGLELEKDFLINKESHITDNFINELFRFVSAKCNTFCYLIYLI